MTGSSAELKARVESLLGVGVQELTPVAGGDIGESLRATLSSGERLFIKRYPRAPRDVVRREAEGLAWLAEAGALPVPRVRGVDPSARLLILEWIEGGTPTPGSEDRLGRGLAALHRSGAPAFGAAQDNFIGPLPQSNRVHDSWPAFYGAERLAPQLRRGRDAGLFSTADVELGEGVIARLPELCGPADPPARLHGDLWRGNLLVDTAGEAWLIDPSAYGGHREIDLAMMKLFGGFSPRVFDAYGEVYALAPGHAERVELFQLYPLLVHANLFGASYAASVRRILRAHL